MNKKNIDKVDAFLIEFAEGRIDFEQFLTEYEKNKNISKVFDSNEVRQRIKANGSSMWDKFGYSLNEFIEMWLKTKNETESALMKAYAVQCIHDTICYHYLRLKDIPYKQSRRFKKNTDEIEERESPQIAYHLRWIELTKNEIEKLLAEVPQELKSITARKKWINERAKEIYKSESGKYPVWIQDPEEWPRDADGIPLVYRRKKTERNSEVVQFIFFNPKTGIEVIIEQYY